MSVPQPEPARNRRLSANCCRSTIKQSGHSTGSFDPEPAGYLPEKKATTADVLALKGAKRLHIVTLRDLTAEQFADALVEGMHKNLADAEVEPLKARIEQFRVAILALKEAAKGVQVEIDWLPATGTRLTVGGQKRGDDVPGEDFYKALLRIWLGDKPAQDDLKGALLGG